jgi:hypothetical protein
MAHATAVRDHHDLHQLQRAGAVPTFFIVGAQKAGTTALAATLAEHPEVFFSPIKEPNFFAQEIDPRRFDKTFSRLHLQSEEEALKTARQHDLLYAFIRTPAAYGRLFEGSADYRARGEGSVSYLYSTSAPANIAQVSPDARIIIVLREPVARAFSHFKMQRRAGLEPHSDFVGAVEADAARPTTRWGEKHLYVELGRYAPQLRRYLRAFAREQLLVLFHDELTKDPANAVARALRHIGVDARAIPPLMRVENVSSVPRFEALNRLLFRTGVKRLVHRTLPPRVVRAANALYYTAGGDERLGEAQRRALHHHFADDIAQVEDLLEKDLAGWRPTA